LRIGHQALRAAVALAIVAPLLSAPSGRVFAASPLRANPVYRLMLRQTAGIRTSECDIEVQTKLRSFPPASFTFRGHSYFEAPDKQAVVFDNVPGPLRGMFKDSPHIAPAPLWPARYEVTIAGDDGSSTTFHLVPKDPDSAIDHADVIVDDNTGLVSRFTFVNKNGSTVTTDNTYDRVGRYQVVVSQTGSANGRGYRAEVTSTFSNYQFNLVIPDSVFEEIQ
jgi:hypothetical protein